MTLKSGNADFPYELSQFNMGIVPKGTTDFDKAMELSPENSFIPWNNIGKLYYQQGDYQKAIEAYEESIGVKDDYLPPRIGLGNAQKSLGKSYLALQAYEQAIEIDPKSHEAWYSKGSIEESLNEYEAAREAYQQAITLKPDWKLALKALKRVQRKMGIGAEENN